MDEDYLNDLKEEGCKLIKLSNELKYAYLSRVGGHQVGGTPPNKLEKLGSPKVAPTKGVQTPALASSSGHSPWTSGLQPSAADGLDSGLSAQRGRGAEQVLSILYNNYKLILKKYEELNEQKQSYIEGIREYQYKLDNYNYTIQLQKRLLIENSERALQLNNLQSELRELKGQLASRKASLDAREVDLKGKRADLEAKEASLEEREAALEAKQASLDAREATLSAKEATLSAKEAELNAREASLSAQASTLANASTTERSSTTNF